VFRPKVNISSPGANCTTAFSSHSDTA
jgi:hypothetical protein